MTSTDHDAGGGHHYSAAELHNEDVAHEHSDVNVRTIISFGIGMAVMVIASAGLVLIMFRVLESQAERRDPQLSPLALPAGQRPPAPRLIEKEPEYLFEFRAEEAKKLDSYGWVDERGGIARVPIDRAKTLLLERGLPVRPGASTDRRVGTHAPAYGEASSGRTIKD